MYVALKNGRWICLLLGLTFSLHASTEIVNGTNVKTEKRPNFLLIVLDDLGYSDLGSFGGEIRTPNLDGLAHDGIRFTHFYAAAACSPSRAMLLTGADSHLVGLGNMSEFLTPEQEGKPGYEGRLNNRVDTLARRLNIEGYHTYMAGKWHLGAVPGSLPNDQGFERSFALMEGAANHFDARGVTAEHPAADYREQGKPVALPDNFFSSQTYTDKLISYLRSDRGDEKPFFAYLAYTAPHWPIQAPQQFIERNRGKYDQGYDHLRRQRLEKMAMMGIIPEAHRAADLPLSAATGYRPWAALSDEERRRQARTMEVYAAMVEAADDQIGRILNELRKNGELDNTVIVFLSDNGAEGFDKSDWPPFSEWVEQFDQRFEAIGSKDAFSFYGPGWGTAGTAPYRMFKGFSTEGGLRTPAFVWAPNVLRQSSVSHSLVTVMDIAPTLLELAGIRQDDQWSNGQWGSSMAPYLRGEVNSVHSKDAVIGWELMGNAAIRQGDWKLVRVFKPFGSGEWQLFNLARDPGETNDLAATNAAKYRALRQAWDTYASENGVVLPEWGWVDKLKKAYLFGWEALF